MAGRVATYRVQLTPEFGFAAAEAIVPDLARLGVSHLYLSPVAEAVPGSSHGYDVTDPEAVREELGGRDALWSLAESAADHGLALLVDIVPNHLASHTSPQNRWWWELLRDGRDAATAEFFDVDWDAGDGKILLPFLGESLDDAVAAGSFQFAEDRSSVHHGDRVYPLHGAGADGGVADVLADQYYRLTAHTDPARNVRRFFAVDQLVGIRPEVPAVAQALHRTVLDLEADQLLDGVRLDHIDGLADPTAYLRGLRVALGDDAWILVEKIVVGDEQLSPDWPVDGTTGYEWITLVDHLFTHPDGEETFTRLWRETTGDALGYHEHESAGIRDVLGGILRPEVERLARCAAAEAERAGGSRRPADFVTPIVELTVHLGRYRTYLGSRVDTDEGADLELVRHAADLAAAGLGEADREALSVFVDLVASGRETAQRWQQLSGPALAKGGEDTALYRSMRLTAHNEVGGDPGTWTTSVETFHAHNERTARHHPDTMLAASTHDTKRSEDVRTRLLALAEVPDRWASTFRAWRARLARLGLDGWAETLALQTVVGAWPIDGHRLGDFLVKAAREAAIVTTWGDPDTHYETRLRALAAELSTGDLANDVAEFVESIDPTARSIALAQTVLRLTAPGVPDLYQCSETWLRTLVDPDNRRPLDPGRLAATVAAASTGHDVWSSDDPKAAVIARVLRLRRRHPDCFAGDAGYEPLGTGGRHADHVIAYARGGEVAVVAARFPLARSEGWADTAVTLPSGRWTDVLTGRTHDGGVTALSGLLGAGQPAAVLEAAAD